MMRGDNRRAHCVYILFGIGAAVLGEATTSALGQCQANELAKLTASDAAAGDEFGRSVSIDGDVAVIGARRDSDAGNESGSAYVYRFDGTNWIEEAELTASDAAPGDEFGSSVSIDGDAALIAAYQNDDAGSKSGSAYVFRFDGTDWIEETKLTASDAAENDYFGFSVSIDGDLALVGARGVDGGGAAYVFRYNGANWIEEAKLTASDGAAGDALGFSVSISGEVGVIGAVNDDDACPGNPKGGCGSAYVYRFDPDTLGWKEEAKLTASDAAAIDGFGYSVSISGETTVIGAWNEGNSGFHCDFDGEGAAYVFWFDPDTAEWIEQAKLTASDAAPFDLFGTSVSVGGGVTVIGAIQQHKGEFKAGSAYVFKQPDGGWVDMTETAKLTASDAADHDYFGVSVSLSADIAVIGAFRDDDAGSSSGSAYVFRGLADCNDNGALDICDIARGPSQDANGNGIPDECECPWDLDIDGDVGILDLLALLAAWGTDPGGPPDFDGDGTVGILDLLALLANWGACN